MPNQIRTVRVKNRKTGEEIDVPFDAIVKDARVKLPGHLLGSPTGAQDAVQESKHLNLQQLVEEATKGLPTTTFQERNPNFGNQATSLANLGAQIGVGAATQGASIPLQMLLGGLTSYGVGEIGSALSKKAGFEGAPSTGENVVDAGMGEAAGLALRGITRGGSEIAELVKAVRDKDPTQVNSSFLKWFANHLQPKLEGKKGKVPYRQPFEPALPDIDTEGELSSGQWLTEGNILDHWMKNKYPLQTSQANSSDLAARLEAMNPQLPTKMASQNLAMQNMSQEVAPVNLYKTAEQRGMSLEEEVKAALESLKLDSSITNEELKTISRSKLSRTAGRVSGEGKPGSIQSLKSPEQSIDIPLESDAEFGRFMTTMGKERSSQFLREELLTRAFDTTAGAFDAASARTFIREHTGKFMKALDSEERHAVNKFIASLDMQQRRLASLSYTPAAQASGGRQFQALIGAAAVTGPKGLTSMVAGRQAAGLGTIIFERKALAKIMSNPKFAYAAAGLMELPGGTPATKGKLRTVLQAAAKAGVNFKLLRLDGVEQNVSSNEKGDLVFPGGQEFSLDNFYPRQEE
jgi:hypothetical protein